MLMLYLSAYVHDTLSLVRFIPNGSLLVETTTIIQIFAVLTQCRAREPSLLVFESFKPRGCRSLSEEKQHHWS